LCPFPIWCCGDHSNTTGNNCGITKHKPFSHCLDSTQVIHTAGKLVTKCDMK
jgi:hypothetical protein